MYRIGTWGLWGTLETFGKEHCPWTSWTLRTKVRGGDRRFNEDSSCWPGAGEAPFIGQSGTGGRDSSSLQRLCLSDGDGNGDGAAGGWRCVSLRTMNLVSLGVGLAVEKDKPVSSRTLLPRQLPPPLRPPFSSLVFPFLSSSSWHPLHSSVHPAPPPSFSLSLSFSGPTDLMQSCWLVVRMWLLVLWALGSFWLWLARWLPVWCT